LLQLPTLALRFLRFARRWRHDQPGHTSFLLTHFTTFFFAWLQPQVSRLCFHQDKEWLFVEKGWKRELLKVVILVTSRRSSVVTANSFISREFERYGVPVLGEASIWADPQWLADDVQDKRSVDITMLLRLSPFKRLDLYLALMKLLNAEPGLRVTIVTPEDAIPPMLKGLAHSVLLRPSNDALKELFGNTRLFVLLSDVEGFALPPLEAMGSGAVPFCRDSGGVRNYMREVFAPLLIPKSESMEMILDRLLRLLAGKGLPSPQESHQAFARGLAASRETRMHTIRRLSVLLQGKREP
jgi:glycosyltransferase involved in cell wall biosynthesis